MTSASASKDSGKASTSRCNASAPPTSRSITTPRAAAERSAYALSRFAEVDRIIDSLEATAFAWYATLGIGFVECAAGAATLTAAREKLALIVEAGNPGIDAWGHAGNAFPIMQNLKQRFDPERRLNPGRFAGGL